MQVARFVAGNKLPIRLVLAVAAVLTPSAFAQDSAGAGGSATLEKIRAAGKLTLGYYADARPLSFRNETGSPDGYGVALCKQIATDIQAALKTPELSTQFVAVDGNERFAAVKDGRIDILCGPSEPTLTNRAEVSFSIPVFESGTGVLVRKDSPAAFRDVLEGRNATEQPLWRGSPQLVALQSRSFAVVAGSAAEKSVAQRREQLKLNASIISVPDFASGVRKVADGSADALFGDRTVLLDFARRDPASGDLVVLDRTYNSEPLALAVPRNDEDFRLLVDRSLSGFVRSGKIAEAYERFFGKPDATTAGRLRNSALPE